MQSYSVSRELTSKAIARRGTQNIEPDVALALWERNGGGVVNYGRPDHHTLSVYVAGGRGVRCLSSKHSSRPGRTGLQCVIPAAAESKWTNSDYVSMLHVYFTDEAFQRITGKRAKFSRAQTYVHDPLMFGLASTFVLGLDWNDSVNAGALEHSVFAMINRLGAYDPDDRRNHDSRQLSSIQKRHLLQLIDEKLDGHIGVSQLAETLKLSVRSTSRRIHASFGQSPHQLVVGKRVDRAIELIESGMSIIDASVCCGFSSQSHMTRQFKKVLGATPGRLTRKAR